ncbi:MAG: hypothetical protein HY067_09640 [Betaproteobacteria bacterium]|nr:hypothetical protein [Betaproteobacteria bacterium]
MGTIYQFPEKDERQWQGVAVGLSDFLSALGASPEEAADLLPKLRARWDALGKPFSMELQYAVPSPLSAAQVDAIHEALQQQAAEITAVLKTEHAATLFEFAKLELELLRLHGECR